jgi:chromosomal replication initiation ATPase DnaA
MKQIALPLEWPADPRDDEFLITPATARAAHLLEHWATWPVMTALLVGPRKSGRSLLARIFAAKSGGTILDDAQARPEAALFHAWNEAQAQRRPLVIVADAAPPEWAIALPDLRSRLGASPVATIEPPDDALIRALLRRQFERRGIEAPDDVLAWMAARMERSHIAVTLAVDRIDEALPARRRRLGVPFVRGVLAERRNDPLEGSA